MFTDSRIGLPTTQNGCALTRMRIVSGPAQGDTFWMAVLGAAEKFRMTGWPNVITAAECSQR